jgi:hypothetical protein
MENPTATNTNKAPQNTDQKSAVLKEICSKWSKFSEQDVAALKGKADLVTGRDHVRSAPDPSPE